MKLPYFTIGYDKYTKRIKFGFAIYVIGVGCVLWTDKLRVLIKMWECF